MITFDEKEHKYTNPDGVEYISATTLIGKYKPKFDVEKMTALVAKKEGVTQDFVKDVWQQTTDIACKRGTEIHKFMETWLLGVEIEPNEYVTSIQEIWQPDLKQIYPERLLWLDDFKLAGTTDVLEEHVKYFNLYDFKTNKKFSFNTTSKYHEYMLAPLDHLPVCEYTTYALQLSLYAYMYSKMSKKPVGELACFYYNKEKWVKYNTPYMKYEVLMMLSDWKKKQSM